MTIDEAAMNRLRDDLNRAREERDAARRALALVDSLAKEARAHWDLDRDALVGKILIALAGGAPSYRADIDEIRAALEPIADIDAAAEEKPD
jgi:hypothetical protein